MNLLSNILIQPNVITDKGIEFFTDYIKSQKQEDQQVFDVDATNNQKDKVNNPIWKTDKEARDTQTVSTDPVMPQLYDLFKNIVSEVINPFYNFEIYDSEVPQFLIYNVGGHYRPHIDGESLWTNPDKSVVWRKGTNRDLSIVLYLNDDFEGGELIFPDLHIQVKPEPGLLVAFPSTHQYKHGVVPVTKGTRYAIVNWMTVKGFPTMEDQEKEFLNKYKDYL